MSRPFARALLFALLIGVSPSCKSTKASKSGSSSSSKPSGPPPKVAGSSARPVDNLPRSEYPFDEHGNYVTAWAAEGDRKYAAIRASSSSSRSSSSRSSSSRSRSTSTASRSRYHSVSRGDTLYGISRRYGKSVSAIKSANGLRSDTIRIGQRLKIP